MAKLEKKGKVSLTLEQKQKRYLQILKDKWMYLLMLPGVLYFMIFKFAPLWGVLIAFKKYYASSTFAESPWVGLENFTSFFTGGDFGMLLGNTLVISLLNLIFYFPAPIILALLLNEVAVDKFKRGIQTAIYVPHFVSMVVVFSITYVLCKSPNVSVGGSGGIVFEFVKMLGGGNSVDILSTPIAFKPLILVQTVWKEIGWGTIIFLAALAGVDVEQYEAAIVDGANRWQQTLNITLPAIKGTVVIMLILRMGSILDNGFEQILLMQNDINKSASEVLDTYIYNLGRVQGNYGFTAAVGLFKAVVGIVLIQSANYFAKKVGEGGIF